MHSLTLLLVLVVVCTLLFDYINGFHDTANAIATVVSTRVLSPRNAIIMAACLNFVGALFSTHVAVTVASGLVDTARFRPVDIHQPAAFAVKLKNQADPVSRFLAEQGSPETKKLLAGYVADSTPTPELQAALVADLNRIITGSDFYSAERFTGIALPEKTVEKALKIAKLKPAERASTNRALLENAYVAELGSNQHGFQVVILAAIVGAIVWNLLTWYFGIPSSSSHALIGGLCGAAIVHGGLHAVLWDGIVRKVLIPLVGSPTMGFLLGFVIMTIIYKTLSHVHPGKVSATFRHLQLVSAAAMAFTHGLNDAQKSMGIITMALVSARIISEPVVPTWVVLSCSTVMALGSAPRKMRPSTIRAPRICTRPAQWP